ncbi:MAG: hypothetical protein P8N02_18810 [Actinomycetota bacterium]|jgi:hypothetical protein|nr:hypothetical protein [Actinomycetota bacterium]
MAAITNSPDYSDHGAVVDAPVATNTAVATEDNAEAFWGRFGYQFTFTALAFTIFLFVGGTVPTIAGGSGTVGGIAVGAFAAAWGVPTFGALFAANLASDDR